MFSHQTMTLDIHTIDKSKEFAAFLQPHIRDGRALEIFHPSAVIHNDGRRALDKQKIFFQLIQLIHFAFRVGEHREGQVQDLHILLRPLKRIAQNNDHLGTRFFELFMEFSQLGNMRAALHSDKFADEEQHYLALAAKIRECDRLSVRCLEFEIWRERADLGVNRINRVASFHVHAYIDEEPGAFITLRVDTP